MAARINLRGPTVVASVDGSYRELPRTLSRYLRRNRKKGFPNHWFVECNESERFLYKCATFYQ